MSLPVKTLDPRLTQLDQVLAGPEALTWLVVQIHVESWGLTTSATESLIATAYHPVATIAGETVYLHDGAAREPPATESLTPEETP